MPFLKVSGWNHVGIKVQFTIVGVFVSPVSLVANRLDSKERVFYLIHEIEKLEGWESYKDEDDGRDYRSDGF